MPVPQSLEPLLAQVKYDLILFFEPLPQHKVRVAEGKMLNREISERWSKFIWQEYEARFGKDKIIKVPYFDLPTPEQSIEARFEFVKKLLVS